MLRGEERMCAQWALGVSCLMSESTQQIRQGARRWGACVCALSLLFMARFSWPWQKGAVRHALTVFHPKSGGKKWCPKRMEGSSERSPKWQNLKLAEISVWRRVSDLFYHALFWSFFGLLFPLSFPRGHKYAESCTHSFGCLLIFMQTGWKRCVISASPTLLLAATGKNI